MTELAIINARIDRLNRKLKADPIVVVSECAQISLHDSFVANSLSLYGEDNVTIVCDSLDNCLLNLRRAVRYSSPPEKRTTQQLLFARKIQLAILERLTG